MGANTQSSRVSFLVEFIQEYTPKGGRILDVGCGDMTLAKLLPDYDWVGIDINTTQSQGKAIECDLDSPPYAFADATFDTIVCSEVLEHMFNPGKITEEIRRLIKPTGTYILSTPNFQYIDHYLQQFDQLIADLGKPWTYEHIRQYSYLSHLQILENLFEPIGVVGADAQYSGFFSQGRAPLRDTLESLGLKDPDFVETDKLIGQMFPLHNHTLLIIARPI